MKEPEDIHDFISQLDEKPSYLHGIHYFQVSSDDDGTSEDSTSSDYYKPPLLTIEQLNEKLVEIHDDLSDDSISENEDENDRKVSENISKLSRLIAEVYCEQEEHYKQTGDFEVMREAVQRQLVKLQIDDTEEIKADANSSSDRINDLQLEPSDLNLLDSNTTRKETAQNEDLPPDTPQDIANALSQLITSEKCFVCDENSEPTHYKRQAHFKEVRSWLQEQFAKLKQPAEMKMIFCEICNLPLSGNRNAEKHYDSVSHKNNAEIFCRICLRVIGNKIDMPAHLKSRRHLNNEKENENESIEMENKKANNNASTKEGTDNVDMKQDLFTKENISLTYASAVKGSGSDKKKEALDRTEEVKDDKHLKKDIIIKDYGRLAKYILNFLSQPYCYICNVPNVNHYRSQRHNINFRLWLQNNTTVIGLFDIERIEEVVCIPCRTILCNSVESEKHYASNEHKGNIATFCKKCMMHDDPANHVTHRETSPGQSKSIKESIGPVDPGMVLASNLKLLCAPFFCELCKIQINTYNFFHYSDRNHILMVRTWLGYGMQKIQTVIDPKLVFCEPCGLVLCGTKSAQSHYQLPTHRLNQPIYCSACVFRGTPNIMGQHYCSLEHKINCGNLLFGCYRPLNQGNTTENIQPLLGQALSYQQQSTAMIPYEPQQLSSAVSVASSPVSGSKSQVETNLKPSEISYNNEPCANPKPRQNYSNTTENIQPLLGQALSYQQQSTALIPYEQQPRSAITISSTPVPTSKTRLETTIATLMSTQIPKENIPKKPAEEDLYKQLNEEVKMLLETLYFSENLPVKRAIMYVKRLNADLLREKQNIDRPEEKYGMQPHNTSDEFVRINDIQTMGTETSEAPRRTISPTGSQTDSKTTNGLVYNKLDTKCSIS